jgi:hypothetical protein
MKALLGQKNQFEGQESPHSNIVEVSKNPKEQFGEQKPTLEKYEGAAGPK